MRVLKSRWAVAGIAVLAVGLIALVLAGGEDSTTGGEDEPPVATASESSGSTDDFIADLQDRLREDPENFPLHIDLANAYLQKVRENGDSSLYTNTEELLDRAEEIEPGHPELLATRGILALARHEFAEARDLGREALAQEPGTARYHGIIGDAEVELGMYEEAVGSYQQMVDLRPDFDSFSRVAHARELHGDPDGAIEALESTIGTGTATGENTAWAYVQLGNLQFTVGDLEEATMEYERSLNAFPDYPLALAGQARVAAARGELQDAAALYEEAFNRMPLAEHAIALGDVYAAMGEEQRATEQYELVQGIDQLFQADGMNTDLETALFFADQDLEPETSLEKARAAYEARPSIHAADVLAWNLYKTGDPEEAEQYADEALVLGTRDPVKLFHAGMISSELGRDEQAIQYLREALELNPQFSILHSDTAAAELEELEKRAANSGSEKE